MLLWTSDTSVSHTSISIIPYLINVTSELAYTFCVVSIYLSFLDFSETFYALYQTKGEMMIIVKRRLWTLWLACHDGLTTCSMYAFIWTPPQHQMEDLTCIIDMHTASAREIPSDMASSAIRFDENCKEFICLSIIFLLSVPHFYQHHFLSSHLLVGKV